MVPETVLRWYRDGKLRGTKLSRGAVRFREVDVDAFIEEHMNMAGSADQGVSPPQGAAHRELSCLLSPPDSRTKED